MAFKKKDESISIKVTKVHLYISPKYIEVCNAKSKVLPIWENKINLGSLQISFSGNLHRNSIQKLGTIWKAICAWIGDCVQSELSWLHIAS